MAHGFDIICLKCGSENCEIVVGEYKGEIEYEIQCLECDQVE